MTAETCPKLEKVSTSSICVSKMAKIEDWWEHIIIASVLNHESY